MLELTVYKIEARISNLLDYGTNWSEKWERSGV